MLLERQIDPAKPDSEAQKALESIHKIVGQLTGSSLADEQIETLEKALYRRSLEVAYMPPFSTGRDYFKLKLDTEITEHLNGELSRSSWRRFITTLQLGSTVDSGANWQKLLEVTTKLQRNGDID